MIKFYCIVCREMIIRSYNIDIRNIKREIEEKGAMETEKLRKRGTRDAFKLYHKRDRVALNPRYHMRIY